MSVGAAIAIGVVVGLALGILVSVTTDIPFAPEIGLVLVALVGWLRAGARSSRGPGPEPFDLVRRSGCHLPAEVFRYAGFATARSPPASACRIGDQGLKPLKVQ